MNNHKDYTVTVENPHPARSAWVRRFTRTSPEDAAKRASRFLAEIGERLGISPLALRYEVVGVRA